MAEIVLKGELHTSSGDLEDERALVKEGIDTLVLEGPDSEAEFGRFQNWFSASFDIFSLVMGNMYVGKQILVDLAESQGAEVVRTRKSDAELLNNTVRWLQFTGAATFYILVASSLLIGLYTGRSVLGAAVLFMGAMIPILTIRVYNMEWATGDKNRDQIMADAIVEAADDGRVLAIVGARHVEGIVARLPDDVVVEVRGPVYGVMSLRHVRELVTPGFTAFSVLFVLYLTILYLFELVLPLVR